MPLYPPVKTLPNQSATPATPTGGVIEYASGGGLFVVDPNGSSNSLIAGPQTSSTTAGALAETAHCYTISGSQAPTSGTLYIQRVFLPAGTTVSKVGFVTSTTAATGPTHWWTALLDNTYKQQAHSADQLTTAIGASTWLNLSMATPFVTTYSGQYYLALMIATSSVQPTVACATNAPLAPFITGTGVVTPLPNGASTAALTAPGTDGTTTYAAPTVASAPYYMFCQ